MANNSIAIRIQDLIGTDMDASLVTSYVDLVNAGFNAIADLIPVTSELWSTSTLNSATTQIDVTGKKVILVTRTESGDVERICREMSYRDYLRGQAPGSIFYIVIGSTITSFTIEPSGTLKIAPALGSNAMKVYYFQYITSDITSQASLQDADDADGAGKGFPQEAEFAGCIASAINLLQARVSFAVQDDEDMELVQLLQAQSASLQAQLQGEAQRLGLPYKIIGAE